MNISDKCSNITVYNFYKIVETNEYRYLIKGFEDNKEKYKETFIEKYGLHTIFDNILLEYSNLVDSVKLKTTLKKKIRYSSLLYKHSIAIEILNLYVKTNEVSVLELLKKLGHKLDANLDLPQQIESILNEVDIVKNKINIEDAKAKNQIKNNNEKINLDLVALRLEKSLELKYPLIVKDIFMDRWVNLHKYSKELYNLHSKNK